MVLEPQTAAFLTDRAALIVAVVDAAGRPLALRGWGLVAESPADDRMRLLVDGAEAGDLSHLVGGGAIAVTGSDVPTLRSVQVKGHVLDLDEVTVDDLAVHERHCDGFFADVERTDHVPRHLTERLRPEALVACRMVVAAVFDQTPGPGAGSPVAAGPR